MNRKKIIIFFSILLIIIAISGYFIIKNITLLSTGEKLEFERSDTKLTVKANSRFSDNYPICFKIEID